MAEAALLFGWEPERVLKMRARLFFLVMKAARKRHYQERDSFIADLCNVASIAYNAENYKRFAPYYRERAYGKPKVRQLDLKDEKTAHIMAGAFWASSPIRRH